MVKNAVEAPENLPTRMSSDSSPLAVGEERSYATLLANLGVLQKQLASLQLPVISTGVDGSTGQQLGQS